MKYEYWFNADVVICYIGLRIFTVMAGKKIRNKTFSV